MQRAVVVGLLLLNIHGESASKNENSIQDAPPKDRHLTFVALLTAHDGGVVCSGAIVHESYVLTAAGCFLTESGDMISYHHKVLIGDKYKTIKHLLPHPAYRLQTNYYDVGLIRLSEPVRFGSAVTGIKLARVEQMEIGDLMRTACWLMDDQKSFLKAEKSHVIMRSLCGVAPALGLFITSALTCARVHNRCDVNKGSPLYDGDKLYGVATRHFNGRTIT